MLILIAITKSFISIAFDSQLGDKMVRSQDNRNALYVVCSTILIGILVFVWLSAPSASKPAQFEPGCLNNNHSCENGLSCINNKCVLVCSNNLCPASKSCINNICQPAAAVSNLKISGFDSSTTFSDKFAVGEKRIIDSHTVSLSSVNKPDSLNSPSSAVVSFDNSQYKIDEEKSLTLSSTGDETVVLHLYRAIPKSDGSPENIQQTDTKRVTDSTDRQISILIASTNQPSTSSQIATIDASSNTINPIILSQESAYLEITILKRKAILLAPNCDDNSVFYNGSCQKCALKESGFGQIIYFYKRRNSNASTYKKEFKIH